MTQQKELQQLYNGGTPTMLAPTIQRCGDDRRARRRRDDERPLGERSRAVRRQKIMVYLGNAGVLGAGMSVALPSVTVNQLIDTEETFHLSDEEVSWFSSMNSMACPLGGLLVGYLMDRIGRKNTLLFYNILGVVAWALLSTAPWHSHRDVIYAQMLAGRFLSGLMIGLAMSPGGVYSAEISLPRIRGRLILATSIGIAAGILLMYILGYFIRRDWQLICIISCIYQLFSALCILPMPESPSWLMQKQRTEMARASLKYFRGISDHDANIYEEFETELAEMKMIADRSRTAATTESFRQALRTPEVYKPLLLMIGFFAFQQFAGVVLVVVFAVQFSQEANVSIDPWLCAVFVGVARIVTTCFMGGIFERWGRRPAGICSAMGMSVCMLLLAANSWYPNIANMVPLLPAICIILHIVFSTMGLLTLPFFMISEVFPQRVRGTASGLTICFGLLISFVVIKMYPSMRLALGTRNLFAFYGGVSLVGVAYIYYLIPETRGRTLLQIEEYFRSGRKVSSTTSLGQQQQQRRRPSAPTEGDVELKEVFIKK